MSLLLQVSCLQSPHFACREQDLEWRQLLTSSLPASFTYPQSSLFMSRSLLRLWSSHSYLQNPGCFLLLLRDTLPHPQIAFVTPFSFSFSPSWTCLSLSKEGLTEEELALVMNSTSHESFLFPRHVDTLGQVGLWCRSGPHTVCIQLIHTHTPTHTLLRQCLM